MNKKDDLNKIIELNDELDELLKKESDLYKKALVNGDKVVEYERNGKKVKATEKEAFEEIRIVGLDGEVGKVMTERYKDLFETAKERELKNTEMHNFVQKSFGFNLPNMTLGNYIKLTQAVVEYMLEEKK